MLPFAEQQKLYYTFDNVCLALAKRMLAHIVASEGRRTESKSEEEDAEQQRACQQASASGESVDASEFLGGRFGGLIEAIDGQEVDFARRQVTAMKIEVAAHQRRKLVRRNSLTGSLAGRGPRRLVSRTVH